MLTLLLWYACLAFLFPPKRAGAILAALLAVLLLVPAAAHYQPEVLYTERSGLVSNIQEKGHVVPAVYLLDTHNNRFLDDIYLFSLLDHSYVAKDIAYTPENIQKILQNTDLQNGLFVVINSGQKQSDDTILNVVLHATPLTTYTHIEHLNDAELYYLR